MHATEIKNEPGFLGPLPRILEPGQTQQLTFSATDAGPFWMTPNEQMLNRFDKVDGNSLMAQRNKSELILELQGKGINTKGKKKKELIALCVNNEFPVNCEVPKIKEGWKGKAKRLLLVLWERGFIDVNKMSSYTLTGKKNPLGGGVDMSLSLRYLMAMCPDFLNEQSMMEHIGAKIGVEVMLTPKCHAELAGEGVEYMWACSKSAYRKHVQHDGQAVEGQFPGPPMVQYPESGDGFSDASFITDSA